MAFLAGAYIARRAGTFIGLIQDGISIEYTHSLDEIKGDNLGDSLQDGVYRGGNIYLDFVVTEYNLAALKALIWPWSATPGTLGQCGAIGALASGKASSITLIGLLGTAVAGARVTCSAILAPNYPVRLSFNSRLRRVAVRLQLLPFSDSGVIRWFKVDSTTADTYPALTGFTASPYEAEFGLLGGALEPMGLTEDGFDLEYTFAADPITGDNLGDSVQDYIYRGGNVFLSATFIEFAAAAAALLTDATTGIHSPVGLIMRDGGVGTLVLTGIGANAHPTTLSATYTGTPTFKGGACLAPGYPIRYLLAPRLRRLPLRFQLLPDATPAWFTTTG